MPLRLRGPALIELDFGCHGHVAHLGMTEVPKGAASNADFLRTLSDDEKSVLDSVDLPFRRDEFVVSRWAARLVIARILGTEPAEVPLAATRGCRPVVNALVDVSWSHSFGVVAVAASDRVWVGVDVEKETGYLDRVRRRVCRDEAAPVGHWVDWEARAKLGRRPSFECRRRLFTRDGSCFALGLAVADRAVADG